MSSIAALCGSSGNESQAEPVDPKELESVRQQLEDAQRWNVSLQSRLGAIQNRGGGVGGTSDTGKVFPRMHSVDILLGCDPVNLI